MAMELQPCDRCPHFTYNTRRTGEDHILCDRCRDEETYAQAFHDRLSDLTSNHGTLEPA